MERLPFVLRFGQETAQKPLSDAGVRDALQTLCRAENFSIWQIEDFWSLLRRVFKLRGARSGRAGAVRRRRGGAFRRAGTLPLMYHCIGLRADKSHPSAYSPRG